MAVGRVVQGHRRIDGAGVSENFQQCARGKFVGDGVMRQPCQPQAVEGGGFDEGGAVECEAGRNAHAVDLPVFEKLPVVQAVKGVERGHNTAVLSEFGRRFRLPVTDEIVRRGNDTHRPLARNRQGDHVLRHVAQRPHAEIKALRHNVRPTVVNQNLHIDFGKLRQKRPHFRVNQVIGGVFGGVNPQPAQHFAAQIAQRRQLLLNAAKHRRNPLIQPLPCLRGRHGTGGAV